MQKSIDRILVTHVGSLPRGEELGTLLIDDEAGLSLDKPKITKAIEQRVAYVLNKQHEAGVRALREPGADTHAAEARSPLRTIATG